jgi:hypothetical protein
MTQHEAISHHMALDRGDGAGNPRSVVSNRVSKTRLSRQ